MNDGMRLRLLTSKGRYTGYVKELSVHRYVWVHGVQGPKSINIEESTFQTS